MDARGSFGIWNLSWNSARLVASFSSVVKLAWCLTLSITAAIRSPEVELAVNSFHCCKATSAAAEFAWVFVDDDGGDRFTTKTSTPNHPTIIAINTIRSRFHPFIFERLSLVDASNPKLLITLIRFMLVKCIPPGDLLCDDEDVLLVVELWPRWRMCPAAADDRCCRWLEEGDDGPIPPSSRCGWSRSTLSILMSPAIV